MSLRQDQTVTQDGHTVTPGEPLDSAPAEPRIIHIETPGGPVDSTTTQTPANDVPPSSTKEIYTKIGATLPTPTPAPAIVAAAPAAISQTDALKQAMQARIAQACVGEQPTISPSRRSPQ